MVVIILRGDHHRGHVKLTGAAAEYNLSTCKRPHTRQAFHQGTEVVILHTIATWHYSIISNFMRRQLLLDYQFNLSGAVTELWQQWNSHFEFCKVKKQHKRDNTDR